jgi:hypothetical protein
MEHDVEHVAGGRKNWGDLSAVVWHMCGGGRWPVPNLGGLGPVLLNWVRPKSNVQKKFQLFKRFKFQNSKLVLSDFQNFPNFASG